MDISPDAALAAVAHAQFGCFTTDQVVSVGFSEATLRSRLRDGIWRVVHPGVYMATTTPTTRAAAASAARLRVGPAAMFSHFTGTRLLGMDVRHDNNDIWLRAPITGGVRDWLGVHVTRSRHGVEPVFAHGQPVVPPARTIVDLAGKITERAMTGLLYDVTRRHVVTPEEVAAVADAIGGGAPGLKMLRRVLCAFDPEFEAMVEARVAEGLAAAGMFFTPQVEVWDGPFLLARLDLADEELQLGVEVDGFRYHGSRDAQARDRSRDRRIRPFGWTVMRFDARLTVVSDLETWHAWRPTRSHTQPGGPGLRAGT